MSDSHCPSREELEAYYAGRLDEEPLEVLSEHVEYCEQCQEVLERISELERSQPTQVEQFTSEPECQRAVNLIAGIPRALDEYVPEKVGRYVILNRIGSGGMGSVFKAHDPILERDCVVKLLRSSRALDQASVDQFRDELKNLGTLNHRGIVRALDGGEYEDGIYLVMDYIEGYTLREIVGAGGPLPVEETIRIGCELLKSLEYIHEKGFVHRDVKPTNVMIDSDAERTVKLLDFGLSIRPTDVNQGQAAGTLAFMAPEQTIQGNVDKRADYYSLGATLFYLLTGRAPIDLAGADDPQELCELIRTREPASLSSLRNDLPDCLTRVIDGLLHKQPNRRPQMADIRGAFKTADPKFGKVRFVRGLYLAIGLGLLVSLLFIALVVWNNFRAVKPSVQVSQDSKVTNEFERLQNEVAWNSATTRQDALPGLIQTPVQLPFRWQIVTVYPQRGFVYLNMDRQHNRFACFGADGLVRVFGIKGTSISLERLLPESNTSESELLTLEWSRNGEQLVVAGANQYVSLWEVDQSRRLVQFKTPDDYFVKHVVWSPDEKRLAVASDNGYIYIFSISGDMLSQFLAHQGRVTRLAWVNSGLLSTGVDGNLALTNLESNATRVLFASGSPLTALAVNPVDGGITVAGESGRIFLLSRDGRQSREQSCEGRVSSLCWSQDGTRLVAGAADLCVWSSLPDKPMIIRARRNRNELVTSLSWMSDNQSILAGLSGTLYHVDVDTGEHRMLYECTNLRVMSVAWNPTQDRFAASLLDGSIRQFSQSGIPLVTLRPPQSVQHGFRDLSWHPQGKILASGDDYQGSFARIWDAESGMQLLALPHTGAVLSVAWNPQAEVLATGEEIGALHLWETNGFRKLKTVTSDSSPVSCARWNTEGTLLAVGKESGRIDVYELIDGKDLRPRRDWPKEPEPIRSLAWSPDGSRLAVAGLQKRIYLLDMDSGKTLWTIQGKRYHRPSVLKWSRDGELIACGGCGIISAATGQMAKYVQDNYVMEWGPQGILVEGTWNGQIRLHSHQGETLSWTSVLRANGAATFTPTGKILNPDPQLLDEFAYLAEMGDSRILTMKPEEFFRRLHAP